MKKIIIIIGIIIAFVIQVSATGFSPSSLIFELEKGEKECKMITITSDSETIKVSDKWAENKDVEWKIGLFETDASAHGISINYDNEFGIDERQVEVCLSGQNVGEYHGVILLREEQQGNSIVQIGVWLKVTIIEPQQTPSVSAGAGSSGGGGGGSSIPLKNKTQTTNLNTNPESAFNEEEFVEKSDRAINEEVNPGITGSVIGVGNRKSKGLIIAAVILIVGIGLTFYNKKLRSKI